MSDQRYTQTGTNIPNFHLPESICIPLAGNLNVENEENNRLGNTDKYSLLGFQNQATSSTSLYPYIQRHFDAFDAKIKKEILSLFRERSRLLGENNYLQRAFTQNRSLSHTKKDNGTPIVNNHFDSASSIDQNPLEHESSPLPVSSIPPYQDLNEKDNVNVSEHRIGYYRKSLMRTPKHQVYSSSNALCPYCRCFHDEISPASVMLDVGDSSSPNIRDNLDLCPEKAVDEYSKNVRSKSAETQKNEKLQWNNSKTTDSRMLNIIEKESIIIRDESREKRKSLSDSGKSMETELTKYRRSHQLQMAFLAIRKLENLVIVMSERNAELEQKLTRENSWFNDLEEKIDQERKKLMSSQKIWTATEMEPEVQQRSFSMEKERKWPDDPSGTLFSNSDQGNTHGIVDPFMDVDNSRNGSVNKDSRCEENGY